MGITRKRLSSLFDLQDPVLFQPEMAGDLFTDLVRRIDAGNLVPVISNSVSYESLFHYESGNDGTDAQASLPAISIEPTEDEEPRAPYTIENDLSSSWAELIHYPLPDGHDLARVAQYQRTQCEDDYSAKSAYLAFLRRLLLSVARRKGANPQMVTDLAGQVDKCSLSYFCKELGFPPKTPGYLSPMTILARLPLPLYITTSYHDFLEHELEAAGRSGYRTQVCFWSNRPIKVAPNHRAIPDLELDPARPVVYHLFGLEEYPASVTISEDDYLDFLSSTLTDTDPNDPVIPLYLRQALANSAALLLGYRLQDWDFRTMFRGVILPRQDTNRMRNLIIQLTPEEQYHIPSAAKARDYLKTYFNPKNFDVEWGSPGEFLKQVWDAWNRGRK